MPKAKEDPQTGLFDRTVEDPELEQAIDSSLEHAEAAKAHSKAQRRVKDRLKVHNLEDGERLRVGQFVVEGKARNGGGFEVPAWTSVVGKVVSEES